VAEAAEERTTALAQPQMLVRSAATAPDPLTELKELAREELFARLGNRLYDRKTTEDELHTFVVGEINAYFDRNAATLPTEHRRRVSRELADDVLRHGPIEPFLVDPTVSEIMVNGLRPIWVERDGRLHSTTARFSSEAQLRHVIDRIVGRIGRRVDESTPMVDGRLPDGSRINAVLPPLAVDGPSLTVRKFTARSFTTDDLVNHHTATPEVVALLSACVQAKLNILVSGGTGTGKTTLLNLLSSFVPDGERIVTIEDSCELSLRHENLVRLESRPANVEGRGEVTARGLLRNALRMRPDRIIVGEVRGGEALDMLQAMNTGHDGSLSTLHANSPRDALSRVETMVLMAGMDLPIRAIREQVASAVDLIVHLVRLHDGTRRISQLVEVNGMEGEVITLTDLFVLDQNAGYDESGSFLGALSATGLRPRFADRLLALGVLPPELEALGFDRRRRASAPGLDNREGRDGRDERRGAR
jgi:pilus assembly protein CpaF